MSVYEGFKCYGPYKRNDGRMHVVLVKHDSSGVISSRLTVSYPKCLVESFLDRYLSKSETVDHIDGNFSNNDLSNLRVVDRAEHSKSHTSQKVLVSKVCPICGKAYNTFNNFQILCNSKVCVGKSAHVNGYNQGNSFIREANTYVSNRSLIREILSVEAANSGNSLVDNPEQGDK